MNKALFLLSGLAALCLPCAVAQESGKDFKFQIGNSFAPSNSTSQNKSVASTVSLASANPIASTNGQLGFLQRSDRWHMSDRASDRAEVFSTGSSFVFGEPEDPDRRIMIAPRFTEVSSNDASLKGYSAEIRLGNVVQFDRSSADRGWYVFAAADGEALSINATSLRPGDGNPMAVSLSDQITVGDLQAGVSTYVGDTQLTISYIETEAEYSAPGIARISKKESFAGISLAKSF